MRVAHGVPLPGTVAGHRGSEQSAHHHYAFEERWNVRIHAEQQANIGQRRNAQENHFPGVLPNRAAHELDGLAWRKVFLVWPCPQGCSLLGYPLLLRHEQRVVAAGKYRHLSSSDLADGARQPGTFHRLARNRRDAEQLALGLRQQVRQTNRVIDITADVGVE